MAEGGRVGGTERDRQMGTKVMSRVKRKKIVSEEESEKERYDEEEKEKENVEAERARKR